MRKIFLSIIIGILLTISNIGYSATFYITEKVFVIKGQASTNANRDWMSLENTPSIGSCGTSSTSVVLRFKDNSLADRQMAIALTAKMGGIPVTVTVVDTNKDSLGFCYLHSIYIQ